MEPQTVPSSYSLAHRFGVDWSPWDSSIRGAWARPSRISLSVSPMRRLLRIRARSRCRPPKTVVHYLKNGHPSLCGRVPRPNHGQCRRTAHPADDPIGDRNRHPRRSPPGYFAASARVTTRGAAPTASIACHVVRRCASRRPTRAARAVGVGMFRGSLDVPLATEPSSNVPPKRSPTSRECDDVRASVKPSVPFHSQ